VAYDNKNRLNVIEVDYLNKINTLNDKFDDLKDVIKDLTVEIKELNKRINQV
jgi:prefoldin subunit 5